MVGERTSCRGWDSVTRVDRVHIDRGEVGAERQHAKRSGFDLATSHEAGEERKADPRQHDLAQNVHVVGDEHGLYADGRFARRAAMPAGLAWNPEHQTGKLRDRLQANWFSMPRQAGWTCDHRHG